MDNPTDSTGNYPIKGSTEKVGKPSGSESSMPLGKNPNEDNEDFNCDEDFFFNDEATPENAVVDTMADDQVMPTAGSSSEHTGINHSEGRSQEKAVDETHGKNHSLREVMALIEKVEQQREGVAARSSSKAATSVKQEHDQKPAQQQRRDPTVAGDESNNQSTAALGKTAFGKTASGKTVLGKNKDKALSNKLIRNRFELKRKVGAGGMGTVYKAVDQIMVEANDQNPFVAVKILREELKRNKDAFKALQREYRKSLKLAHPNIVQVYDFDRQGELIYMTMEFLQGKDLQKVFRKFKGRGVDFDKAFLVIEGICDALIHAHNNNLIHYDFKPGNIFITNTGVAKIFDFGISRAIKTQLEPAGEALCFEPQSFTALTPAYASPEMIDGQAPSVHDDIYALAVVTYEMLAGQHPFDRIPAADARDQGLVPKRIKGLSSRQWSTLLSALHFSREERLGSVVAFKAGILDRISSQKVYRRTIIGALFLGVAAFQTIAIAISTSTHNQAASEPIIHAKPVAPSVPRIVRPQ